MKSHLPWSRDHACAGKRLHSIQEEEEDEEEAWKHLNNDIVIINIKQIDCFDDCCTSHLQIDSPHNSPTPRTD